MRLSILTLPMSPLQQVLLLMAIIIVASKGAGAVSKRIGQPAVLGELLVGLVLGPTLLNMQWLIFTESGSSCSRLSWRLTLPAAAALPTRSGGSA